MPTVSLLASAYLNLVRLSRLEIEIEQVIEVSLLNYFVAAELVSPNPWGKEAARWQDRILAPQGPELPTQYAQIARQSIDDR